MAIDLQSVKLGRIPSMKDEDQARYPYRTPARVEPRPYKYHYCRWRPDQIGGTCVGHAVKQLRVSGPVTAKHTGEPSEYDVYDWAIRNDVWTENDNDVAREFGTSVDAGMLAGRAFGWWDGFTWIHDIKGLVAALQTQMVVNGTWWTDRMMQTDSKGYLHFEGDLVGGHAWTTYGYNLLVPYRVPGIGTDSYAVRHGVTASAQSWGLGWGKDGKGTFLMTFDTHEALIQAQGECATPVGEKKH